MAEKIIKRALVAVCDDPQGLSTHSLRKSRGLRLYRASGHDLLAVRDGLGHASVAVTQVYLPIDRARVEQLIRKSDWTRSRKTPAELRARTEKPAAPLPPLEHFGEGGRDAA